MTRFLLIALVAPLVLVGCKDEAKPSAASATASAATARPVAATGTVVAPPVEEACVAYAKALDACVAKVPADERGDLVRMQKQHRAAWENASGPAREQMGPGCQMGIAALHQDDRCK